MNRNVSSSVAASAIASLCRHSVVLLPSPKNRVFLAAFRGEKILPLTWRVVPDPLPETAEVCAAVRTFICKAGAVVFNISLPVTVTAIVSLALYN